MSLREKAMLSAVRKLEKKGFHNLKLFFVKSPTNKAFDNYDLYFLKIPYGHIIATRNNKCYLIQLITRNKYTAKGELNPSYKILKVDVKEAFRQTLKEYKDPIFKNAIPAVLAVQVHNTTGRKRFFFTELEKIEGNNLKMTDAAINNYELL